VKLFSFHSIIALSGTPIVNRPIEFYNILNLLAPNLFSSWWDFVKRYCDPKHNGFGWSYNGATNKLELNNILKKTIMLRRLKKDVLTELPPKTYSTVLLSLDSYLEYRVAKEDLFSFIKLNPGNPERFLSKIQKLRFIAADSKLKSAIRWVRTFLDSSDKLVLFCYHNFFIEQFTKAFKTISVTFCGKTSIEDRNTAVKEFQNNPRIKLFIGGIKSAGVGITLTKSTNLCFFETTWSSGDMFQAEDRVHRIGSINPVTIWYLIAKGTIEEQIIKVLRKKAYVLKEILDGEDSGNNIYNDILKLLMRGK
jgi:SWI/SNF-related matrix-associated actin-dependent regulator 1 of chromatin subfamily A